MYTSTQVCEHLDITYRQLDHVCRTGAIPEQRGWTGSGFRRTFDTDTMRRLTLARILADAMPYGSATRRSAWPDTVRSVMAADTPPTSGYAVLHGDGALYFHDALNPALVAVGCLVVPYDLDELTAGWE